MKLSMRWVVRMVVAASVAAAFRRLLARGAAASAPSPGAVLPAIGGDTWPPVPENPNRLQ